MKLKIKYKVTTDNFDKSFKKWIYLFSKDALNYNILYLFQINHIILNFLLIKES